MKRFPLFPLSRFPALARAAVGGAVALGLAALGVFFFGGQQDAADEFSASLLTSSNASFDLFYLQDDDPTPGSGTWEIPANVGGAAATLDIGLVPNANTGNNLVQVDTAEFLLAGVPTWLSYDSIASSSDTFTVDVVEADPSGDARDIIIFVSPEDFSGDGTDPNTTISGVGNLLTGAEIISVNFTVASIQNSAGPGSEVGSFDIFGTYVGRDAEFTRHQLDGDADGQDGGAGNVIIQDSGIVEPVIASAVPHSATEIRLSFEKAVDANTAQMAANYVVLSCDDAACANPASLATPASAAFASDSTKTVVLTLDAADALVDADTDPGASNIVGPLNVYAVQASNVTESTGTIAINASDNVSGSFAYHVPDIALAISAKDANGDAVTGDIEVHHTLVATVTADTAGSSYTLHSSADGTASCSSAQEHIFNAVEAGVSVEHEFSVQSSGEYSFVVCGGSDADGVVGASNSEAVTIIPETINIQLSLASAADGSLDFDTKDTLAFSITADFSNPSRSSGNLSIKVDSCDASSRQIGSGTVTQFDAADVDGTTTQIDIAATDIGVNTNGYSVVACVESGTASDESGSVGFSIDWALPVVGAPENATLQTTEETQITVTSDIAGSLIVKAFDASFSSTPSCSTGNTLYSSTVDAKSFSVPLIGGLVWDENAKDYHANGLAQGEHTLLACVETAESAYEKQSSAEITVTVEPATAPTVSGQLGWSGTQEMGDDIELTVTSSIKQSTNGTAAYAELFAFESTVTANSCADSTSAFAQLGNAGDVDTTSGERIFEFNTTDLGAGSYVLRACVTANNATGENTTAWGLEVADYYAPVASLTPVTASIDTTQSVQFTVEETDDVPVSDGLVAKVYDISDNSTLVCASDLSGRTIIHQDDLTDQNNKQTTFTLAGDQVTDDGLAAGSYTYLACVTRTKGEVDITSEGSTATLTVSPAGAPGVSGATATPSPAYPNDEVTVTAIVTQGTSAWDAGEGSATLYLDVDSCSAADTAGATQLGEVFSLGNSSASGETASFTFDASQLGSFGTHELHVCASANGSDSGADTVSVVYQDFETPIVTTTITPASIYTNEQAIIKVESDYDGDVVVYTNESSCDVNSTPVFTGSIGNGDTANIGGSVSFNILGEYHAGGTFAAGDYNFIACVDRGESYGNKTGSATATLEVQQTEKPVVSSATASPAIAYPDQTVTVTATITDGGSSWNDNEGTATLYMDANSCSDLSGAVPLGDTFFLGASSSTQNATFTFLANDLGSFGTHELHVCASANGSESGSATVDVEYNNLEVTAQMQKSVIDTTQSTNLIISSNAPASLLELYQTYATSCSVASESDRLTSTNDAGILAMLNTSGGVVFGIIGEHASGGSFAQGNYQFLACVTSEGGSTEVGATATLEVTSAAPPVVTADTADLGEVYPNQEVTVTATVTEGGSSWTTGSATLYVDANSCSTSDIASATQLGDTFTLGASSSAQEARFTFLASTLGSFGDYDLLVCATANDVTSTDNGAATSTITLKDFETPVVNAFLADASITTAEDTTLTVTSDLAGTLKVYQTSITSCGALNLPANPYTDNTLATSFSVSLAGEETADGDLAAGTYTYLACVTSADGKTGGSMDAEGALPATLNVTEVDAAVLGISLDPAGEVAKNTEITATVTSDQVNADADKKTTVTLHKNSCEESQVGSSEELLTDGQSGYIATINFTATESMSIVACANINGKDSVGSAAITVKEDEVVIVDTNTQTEVTTTTTDGETATLTADAGQVSSGTTLTLVDLEVEESESLPEEAINAVEIEIDGNLNGSLTLGVPTEGNKLEESMELQKWDETTGEWVTVGEATLSEDGTTYNADITESGKYALVDLAEARKDIDSRGGTVAVTEGELAGTTVEFPEDAVEDSQVAVLEPDPSILPDDSLGAVEIVAEQEDFGDEYVTIVIPSAAPGANENPVVEYYDEVEGIWKSDGIRNTKFINENIDECKAANGGCAPTPDPLASVSNWFIEFETNHFTIFGASSEPAPEAGATPVGIRIADGETFRLGYRQTLALRPAGGTGPYTLSVSPADSGSFTDLSGSAITQVAELEDFVFVPDTPVIGNDGRNGIVLTLTDTKGTSDDASDDEQASMTLDLLRRGNMIDLDESFTNGNDGNQVMAGWNESAPFVPTVTGEESGTLSSVGIRLDFSPNKTLRLLRQQTLVFSAGTGDSHAVSLSDSSAGEIVSGNDGTYTFIPSTADNGGKQTTIIITETTDDSQETTAIPVYILARGNTYDKEDSDGLTTGLDANEIMAGWKNE